MKQKDSRRKATELSRRDFIKTAAAAGAGLALAAPRIVHAQNRGDALNIAMIGVGTEGRVLLMNVVKMEGVRFKAICDIWPYYRTYTSRLLAKYKQPVTEYTDYRDMLAKEKDLDAVIVATPDWVHAEHSIACLKAGINVYCEKEMSNTIENCKQMVLASRESGKLLQIGHQRRSNPRYHMMLDLVNNKKALGRLTNVTAQWNRATPYTAKWTDKSLLDDATLKKYGYDTMDRFRNWRWYKQFSGGPIADLGSHQVDIFHWVLNTPPKSVVASGGNDNYPKMEWYDNVVAVYEWDYAWAGETRAVRGHYDLFSTTSHGGYTETFMGTEGSLVISEDASKGGIRREYTSEEAEWEKELLKKLGKMAAKPKAEAKKDNTTKEGDITVAHSIPSPGRYFPPIPATMPPVTEHGPHLENFFAAVRDKNVKLNCPGEVAYETAVSILRVNDAVAAGQKITFKPEDFKV